MPYFSYISILHLYETLGWWRAGADLRKIQCATSSPGLPAACTAASRTWPYAPSSAAGGSRRS